jgi:hypothetical protein
MDADAAPVRKRKKVSRILWATIAILFASLLLPRKESVTPEAVTNWRSGGESFVIEVRVTDRKGMPVPGVEVTSCSNSGTSTETTDQDGIARLRPGESDVRWLEVAGERVMDREYLGGLFAPSCSEGLAFHVRFRKR